MHLKLYTIMYVINIMSANANNIISANGMMFKSGFNTIWAIAFGAYC